MNKFKVGDTVRCINDCGCAHILNNKLYIVEYVFDEGLIAVEGIGATHCAYRFESVLRTPRITLNLEGFDEGQAFKVIDIENNTGLPCNHRMKNNELEYYYDKKWYKSSLLSEILSGAYTIKLIDKQQERNEEIESIKAEIDELNEKINQLTI